MNERKRPVAMVEAGLLTALAIIFTIVGTYVPFMSFFLIIVAVPLSLVGIRHDFKMLVIAVVSASILSFLVGGLPTFLSVGVMASGIALCVAYCFKKKVSVSHMVIGIALIATITWAISFQLLMTFMNIDFFELLDTSMAQSLEMMKELAADQAQYDAFVESSALLSEGIKIAFPSMIVFVGAIVAFINVLSLRFIMKRLKMPFLPACPFNEFSYDRSVLIGTTIIMALSYGAGAMGIVDLLTLFTNVLIIIAFVFSIQGIAVIDFFLAKRKIPQGFRIFIIIILYLMLNGYIFFGLVGWFDIIFNFRKLERKAHLR